MSTLREKWTDPEEPGFPSAVDPSCGVRRLGAPLLESPAFQRLKHVTFLGILSPKFGESAVESDDGSRADHSFEVASIAFKFVQALGLSEEAQRYAVAWGLTHDIATWPLSHTSEPAFEDVLGVSSREIREGMIAHRKVPSGFWLGRPLRACGVEPTELLKLYRRSGPPEDGERALLWSLIHSPITPDTLEGIRRAGRIYGVSVPEPEEILAEIWRDADRICFRTGRSSAIARFWDAKARVYRDFINRPAAVRRESRAARQIRDALSRPSLGGRSLSVGRSLELVEDEILPRPEGQMALGIEIFRYKPPQVYEIDQKGWQDIKQGAPLEHLHYVLLKSRGDASLYADV